MAELTGRAAGISKGKGGSMHMFSVEHKFYGGHGIVGAQVSLGTGLAFKHKYKDGGVACLFRRRRGQPGPGLRELQHGRAVEAAGHLRDREQPVRDGHERQPLLGRGPALSRGESFRIPGIQVDGMDVLACRGAAEEALAWVRAGKGPIILEMKTYRYRGHSMSDPAKYRSREEVQAVRDKSDPIEHVQEAARGARASRKTSSRRSTGDPQDRRTKPPISPSRRPSRTPAELYTDVLVETY
jgi:pyruvate dehydrogenase E1 component alpha subunit